MIRRALFYFPSLPNFGSYWKVLITILTKLCVSLVPCVKYFIWKEVHYNARCVWWTFPFVGLESLGVPTPSVHVVVSTHGHPDHAGEWCTLLFTCLWFALSTYVRNSLDHYEGKIFWHTANSPYSGNSHIFPDAVQYHGWFVHERTVFNLSNLFDVSWCQGTDKSN